MKKYIYTTLILLSFICAKCTTEKKDHGPDLIAESLLYQSWESTQKPLGSSAYLGLGPYAKCLCTAVFESGRNAEEAFAHSGQLILEEKYHDQVSYTINKESKKATVFLGDSITRSATYYGDQGCILESTGGLKFEPVSVISKLPDAGHLEWPMGDVIEPSGFSIDTNLVKQIVEKAFFPNALTAAFLVVHRGYIIVEEYGQGADKNTQLESWSMGKSLTATLIGRLIQMGKLSLDQKAPVPEWQEEGDPRKEITIKNLLQMSSGLRFPSHHDQKIKVAVPQLEHMYVYTEAINISNFVVNRPLEFVPGSTGRYRNSDPLTLGYILRNIVEKEGRNYWTWPQEELFDRIGIRRQLLETDPYGNFILSGYDFGTARNWARLGMLYLRNGVWEEQRLLPEGFVDFVSSHAPGWDQPVYGGLFWLNGTGELALPKDAFYMAGGGGQHTIIVPSLDLVVVRLGHTMGGPHARKSLNEALELVVKLVGR